MDFKANNNVNKITTSILYAVSNIYIMILRVLKPFYSESLKDYNFQNARKF